MLFYFSTSLDGKKCLDHDNMQILAHCIASSIEELYLFHLGRFKTDSDEARSFF